MRPSGAGSSGRERPDRRGRPPYNGGRPRCFWASPQARMKSHTEYLTFTIPTRVGFVNITPQVEAAVRQSGVREGLVLCNHSRI
jgi:hypothetical protein